MTNAKVKEILNRWGDSLYAWGISNLSTVWICVALGIGFIMGKFLPAIFGVVPIVILLLAGALAIWAKKVD